MALLSTRCVCTPLPCTDTLSYYLHDFDFNSNNGSVGGGLNCEPQGDRLVQCLLTPTNFRHHANSKMYAKRLQTINVYIERRYARLVRQLLRAKHQTQLMHTARMYPACRQYVPCNFNVRPFPGAYSLAEEHVHVHMHEHILNYIALPAFLPAMLLLGD